MKKFPMGIQTFSEMIEANYYYVDKTPFVAKLVESGKYYFLARPRRFGKSLLISTLNAAFSGKKNLFDGLYLEKNWDWNIQYPVIHLSFGGGIIPSRAVLDTTIHAMLDDHATQYAINLRHDELHLKFRELMYQLHQQFKQGVAILIDEYDKPILDNIDDSNTAREIREGLRNLYSVIKDSDAYVKFALLTGVSTFSKVSLFSGLNNLYNITLDPPYATLCGYTEPEIRKVFADTIDGVDFDQLRAWYNGYNFLGEKVYNPYDVLLYLNSRVFKNYWFETGNASFFIKLIQTRQYHIPQLEHIDASEELLGSFDVDTMTLETLLFQTGYLTIDKVESLGGDLFYTLTYPNREVKSSLTNYLLNYLTDAPAAKAKNQKAVYHALNQADLDALAPIFQAFFASIPHDWYRKNQLAGYEGYYAAIFYCYFTALGLEVKAEDATNQGRIDLTVILGNKVYIIEFKVIDKPSQVGRALTQIKAKHYHQKYSQANWEVYLVGVAFNQVQRNIVSVDWEKV